MLKIAITGSIASGKSYVLDCFSEFSVPIFNFDTEVRELLKSDMGILSKIKSCFPAVVENNAVDRKKLGEIVFKDKALLGKLEDILYPVLFAKYDCFLKINMAKNMPLIVAEVPLLFEKKLENSYDKIILVVCSKNVQLARALKREGMTEEKLNAIIHNQMSYLEKKKLADYVINSDLEKNEVKKEVARLMKKFTA